jgi:hypothetical protein
MEAVTDSAYPLLLTIYLFSPCTFGQPVPNWWLPRSDQAAQAHGGHARFTCQVPGQSSTAGRLHPSFAMLTDVRTLAQGRTPIFSAPRPPLTVHVHPHTDS